MIHLLSPYSKFLFFFMVIPFIISANEKGLEHFSLQPGDVILVPLKCHSCYYIEKETNSDYSHVAVVLDSHGPLLAHSLGRVSTITASSLQGLKDPDRPFKIIRLLEWSTHQDEQISLQLKSTYYQFFDGLTYDQHYRWDNVDHNGKELLYCSELITKLLNPFLEQKIPIYPMDYSLHWSFWLQWFEGQVPQGLLGNSPATLEKSELFKTLGITNSVNKYIN